MDRDFIFVNDIWGMLADLDVWDAPPVFCRRILGELRQPLADIAANRGVRINVVDSWDSLSFLGISEEDARRDCRLLEALIRDKVVGARWWIERERVDTPVDGDFIRTWVYKICYGVDSCFEVVRIIMLDDDTATLQVWCEDLQRRLPYSAVTIYTVAKDIGAPAEKLSAYY